MSTSSTYQPPSPSSSATSCGSLHSAALARSRSTSAEGVLPEPKRSRALERESVNEWVATLNLSAAQARVDSPGEYSPARRHSPTASSEGQPELPTPATTPPSPHCASFESPERDQVHQTSTALKARLLARAATLQAQGAFNVPEPQQLPPAPATKSLEETPAAACKDQLVAGLVGACVLAIESIWGPTRQAEGSAGGVLPMDWFVKEVLRRSRTSCSTLQLGLYYLHKSRRQIREIVAKSESSRAEYLKLERQIKASRGGGSYPSPPLSPVDGPAADVDLGVRFGQLLATQNSPVLCGRRMFLASLIAASKYLQDRNYSNRAWARISGLAVNEINVNERAFLGMIHFELHLKAEDFARWTARLAELIPKGAQLETGATKSLGRSATEYPPQEQSVIIRAPTASPPLAAAATLRAHQQLGRSATAPEKFLRPAAPKEYRMPSPADSTASTDTLGSVSSLDSDSCPVSTTTANVVPRKIRALPSRGSAVSTLSSASHVASNANTFWSSGPVRVDADYVRGFGTLGWAAGVTHRGVGLMKETR